MIRSTSASRNSWKRTIAPSPTPVQRATPERKPNTEIHAALQRKAWRMANSTALAAGLARITPNAQMRKQYERTRDACGKHILQADGKLEASYCRNTRWCKTCAGHRAAAIWNAYGAELNSWNDAYFVTLTIPNCEGIELRSTLKAMHHAYTLTIRQLKKQNHVIHALRQTEVTVNGAVGTYHPHLHVVIKGYAAATALVKEWLRRHPDASALGQDVRKADERSLVELVKYVAKVSNTEPREDGTQASVPWQQLNTIYTALRGLRLFVGHGIRAANPADADGEADLEVEAEAVAYTATKRPTERITWTWEQSVRDWVDRETGELLTEFEPNEKQRRWLTYLEAEPPPHVRAVHAAHEHTSTAALAA